LRPSEEVKAAQPSPGSREAIPSWMVQEKISFLENFEVKVYQLISIFPVFVTFGLYTYLLIFYILVNIFIKFHLFLVIYLSQPLRKLLKTVRNARPLAELS
jgi:hypothetical protein